jgi:hypothetical protein
MIDFDIRIAKIPKIKTELSAAFVVARFIGLEKASDKSGNYSTSCHPQPPRHCESRISCNPSKIMSRDEAISLL